MTAKAPRQYMNNSAVGTNQLTQLYAAVPAASYGEHARVRRDTGKGANSKKRSSVKGEILY